MPLFLKRLLGRIAQSKHIKIRSQFTSIVAQLTAVDDLLANEQDANTDQMYRLKSRNADLASERVAVTRFRDGLTNLVG
jgi:hypothetical protein